MVATSNMDSTVFVFGPTSLVSSLAGTFYLYNKLEIILETRETWALVMMDLKQYAPSLLPMSVRQLVNAAGSIKSTLKSFTGSAVWPLPRNVTIPLFI